MLTVGVSVGKCLGKSIDSLAAAGKEYSAVAADAGETTEKAVDAKKWAELKKAVAEQGRCLRCCCCCCCYHQSMNG